MVWLHSSCFFSRLLSSRSSPLPGIEDRPLSPSSSDVRLPLPPFPFPASAGTIARGRGEREAVESSYELSGAPDNTQEIT